MSGGHGSGVRPSTLSRRRIRSGGLAGYAPGASFSSTFELAESTWDQILMVGHAPQTSLQAVVAEL